MFASAVAQHLPGGGGSDAMSESAEFAVDASVGVDRMSYGAVAASLFGLAGSLTWGSAVGLLVVLMVTAKSRWVTETFL